MHELQVTYDILQTVLDYAGRNAVRKILTIRLLVGELNDFQQEWIQRYFDRVSKDSIAEGAAIAIEKVPVTDCVPPRDPFVTDSQYLLCMSNHTFRLTFASLLPMAAMLFLGAAKAAADIPSPPMDTPAMMKGTQTAVLAGGCFWGMEGVFERLKGVVDVTSGYSGGERNTAHYEMVGTGMTGHAESVQIHYDPTRISYGTLLKVFFAVAHDPTELNFQGPDQGTQYRSAIFYANDGQKQVAEDYIRMLDQARIYPKPIVTQVVALKAFYPAEEYHQHFLDNNPDYPYIMYWDLPKIATLQKLYPDLVVKKS